MKNRYASLLLSCFVSCNCFADTGGVFMSNEFPANKLMQENHIYKNAAVFENMGVYSGTVYAKARYRDAPRYCDPGHYLPDNTTECVICAANHFCLGGENAVMEPCPDGLVAPTGTTVADHCGKIMRVGEDSLYLTSIKQTSPALAVRMDAKIYYAKMTPISKGERLMNVNATQSLRSMVEGTEYSIHDNTIQEEQ